MVKHNNVLPHIHFHKWWQRHVRTWFNQPARKTSRRLARQKKLAAIAPRPLQLLRPVVKPPTQRYNIKTRLGRGFSLDELKAVGLSKKAARTIGIAVDHRRRNRCVESLEANKNRLIMFQQKTIRFPRKGHAKKGFGGILDDSTGDALKNVSQVAVSAVIPLKKSIKKQGSRAITEEDKKFHAYGTLRKAIRDSHNVGKHNKEDTVKI